MINSVKLLLELLHAIKTCLLATVVSIVYSLAVLGAYEYNKRVHNYIIKSMQGLHKRTSARLYIVVMA